VTEDLIVSLSKEPTEDEIAVTEALQQHLGASIPFRMFVRVVTWVHRHGLWIGQKNEFERKIRRRASAGIAALAANLALVFGYAAHRLQASGAAEEHAAQVEQRTTDRANLQEQRSLERRDVIEREIEDLRRQLSELRADLRRLTGTDKPGGVSVVTLGASIPVSFLAPDPIVTPGGCGSTCVADTDCWDFLSSCRYCSSRKCTNTLPAQPIQPDAGVDAPGGTRP
jgi:hypothetical protein